MKKLTSFIVCLYALTGHAQIASLSFSGNTNDNSGNGNHATNYGATLTTDRFNNANSAYHFDGMDDYMTIASPFDLPYRTFKVWIYLDTFVSWNQFVLASDNPSLQYGLTNIAVLSTSDNKLRTCAGNSYPPDNYITTDRWYMITIAVDNDSFYAYIDSTLVGARSNNLAKSVDGLTKTVLGSSRGSANSYWNGKIDDLTIWDEALTAEEIKALYIDELENPTTSVNRITGTLQRIYPNPFTHMVTVELNEMSDVQVRTPTGQILYANHDVNGPHSIDTDRFAPGMYILRVSNPSGAYSQVLIKQ